MIKAVVQTNGARRILVCAAQAIVFAFSGLLAFSLRFDFNSLSVCARYLLIAIPIWIIVKSVVFQTTNLNRQGMRYVSIDDVRRLLIANLLGSAIACLLIAGLGPSGFPRSIYLTDLILSFLGTAGLRVMVRMMTEAARGGSNGAPEKRTFIYGAGDAGVSLLKEIRGNPRLAYCVCGFIDDLQSKQDLSIGGIPVVGGGEEMCVLIRKLKIDIVLIAIPSATGAEMTRILSLCHSAGVECKTVPGLAEVIEGDSLAGQIRDVAVEDLLGRTQVRLEENQIRATIENKVVMVTGAAGSIGSELCRQIARYRPAGIVGFEIAESPLFEIDRELRESFPCVPFFAEIGSVQNRTRIDEVLRQYRPAAIYHAAAYKHVPLMEAHAFEAIENNVFGTLNVAESAKEFGVENFVLISSDKAVRPTNVMGATKRIAEMLLHALQNGGTQYIAVRFGNVLGSSGSVIPIFKRQIAARNPITVTHPEMRRFFMTIPEACQLVLQASAIGEGGQICLLDMGEPVKIVELARNLILLSGLKPDEEIKIEFSGVRPGEKLCEELSTLLEDTAPSCHEKIRIYVGNGVAEDDIRLWIESLREICESRDVGRLIVALKELMPDYSPSIELLKRVVESPRVQLLRSFNLESSDLPL
jgi:FlaA1/EpsC-like NDP-sugar epimerase